MQISWPLQQQTEGEREESAACSPAPAPERGAKRAGAGTASWSPTLGRRRGQREDGLRERGHEKGYSTPRGPGYPARPAGSATPHGSPVGAARRKRRPAVYLPRRPARGHEPRPPALRGPSQSESESPAHPRRRSAHSPPGTRSGPRRLLGPLPVLRRRPHPRRGPRDAPSPRLRSVPLLPPVAGLHLPSIAMMGSPWTAPTRWRGRGRA